MKTNSSARKLIRFRSLVTCALLVVLVAVELVLGATLVGRSARPGLRPAAENQAPAAPAVADLFLAVR